jgi:aryl-alcohol dehydrogenase-like predicted oxidoreductase
MAIGDARQSPERRKRTIHAAFDAGITTIDTAPMYDLGACEREVGEAIRGLRGRVQIFSKVGLRWDDPTGEVMFTCDDEHGRRVAVRKNSRPESVRLEVERSLKQLGVAALDAVHVHTLDRETPIADTMGALGDLLREGKLRAIGVSTEFGPDEIIEAQRALGDVPLASVQLHYSLLRRECESDLLPLAREERIGVLAHTSLEMGLLTGKLSPSTAFGPGDLRGLTRQFHPDNIRRVVTALRLGIEPIALDRGVSVASVVLAWVLACPDVTAVVVGASWPEQARANAAAATLALAPEELAAIEHAFAGVKLDPQAGSSKCERCLAQARRVASGLHRRLASVRRRLTHAPAATLTGDR